MHCSTPASTLPGNTPRCWRRKWWMHCSRDELISFRHCQIHQKDCARYTITWSGTKVALPSSILLIIRCREAPVIPPGCWPRCWRNRFDKTLFSPFFMTRRWSGNAMLWVSVPICQSKYGGSIAFDAVVERLTSGDFINDGPMEQGLSCHIGRTVVLRGVQLPLLRVVVTETCQSPNDMAWCRLHGIDLQQVRLLCIKAKNHFRAAFAKHLACIIDVDAPGPAMLDF